MLAKPDLYGWAPNRKPELPCDEAEPPCDEDEVLCIHCERPLDEPDDVWSDMCVACYREEFLSACEA